MAPAQVVYTGVSSGNGLKGTLFQGQKIWFSARVPQRQWFKDQVVANGGIVVESENDADVRLVDHKRDDNAPGTYSYQYVEFSIRNKKLENLEHHVAGQSAKAAKAAKTIMPSKASKIPYTKEEDDFLWRKVTEYKADGMRVFGNKMYRLIAEENDSHTWQSWRDHYVKVLSDRTRPSYIVPADSREESPPVRTKGQTPRQNLRPQNSRQAPLASDDKESTKAGEEELFVKTKETPGGLESDLAQRSPKRKAISNGHDDDFALSSSLKPRPTHKRQRQEDKSSKIKEIPSTPDKYAARRPTRPPSKLTPTKSMLEDLEDDEEIEEDTLSPTSGAPSQTLSEPSHTSSRFKTSELVASSRSGDVEHDLMVRSGDKNDVFHFETAPNEATKSTHHVLDTQTILSGETQVPDLLLAEPDGGWSANSSECDDSNRSATPSQQLLAEAGITIDFRVPAPPGGWNEVPSLPPSQAITLSTRPPQLASHPSAASTRTPLTLTAYLKSRTTGPSAASRDMAESAIFATTMDGRLADVVLEHLKAGRSIPEDVRGVWTDQDDADMVGTDGRGFKRLELKHGIVAFNARWRFLDIWKAS